MDREAYALLPDFLMIRETRVRIEQPGFRTESLVIATTLLDAHPGLQSDSYDPGSGGDETRHRTAVNQLQGSDPDAAGLSAGDRYAGGT